MIKINPFFYNNPETTVDLVDEFIGQSIETGEIGQLGWSTGVGTISNPASVSGRPGIVKLSSGAIINTIARIHLGDIVSLTVFDPADTFDFTFIIRPTTSTLQEMRIGALPDFSAAPPASGIFFEHDTAAGDFATTWVCVTRNASTSTRTDSTITVTANTWYKFRIRRTSSTTIEFYIDGVLRGTHTTNVPTAAQNIGFQVENLEAVTKTIDMDYFRMRVTGLSR